MRLTILWVPSRFALGQVVATPGVIDAVSADYLFDCLARHARGDWGCVCPEDAASNDASLDGGGRLLSAYPIDPTQPSKGYGENTLWILTEGDRSVTTCLLPEEY